ncbi:MAG TPA: outer membrane beta-barrel protein [Xanthobacteraceae bacterium]|jgi:outer membrane immunogenic protein|nr:outer membrane beta-barrel protein [Xanthobacteraceae bacterium]
MRKRLIGVIAAMVLTAAGAGAGDLRGPPPGPCGPPCGPAYPPPQPPPYWYWAGPYVGANLGFQSGVLSNSGARPSGVAGGFQGGYNWQFGQFVAGWESDLQLSSANDVFANYKFSNPWFGTTRGRGGFALNNILFYGTLGLAYGRGHVDIGSLGESNFHVGWTVGAGLEVGLLPNWSVKAEYLFIDLASESYGLTLTNNGLSSNLVRFGVNYRF